MATPRISGIGALSTQPALLNTTVSAPLPPTYPTIKRGERDAGISPYYNQLGIIAITPKSKYPSHPSRSHMLVDVSRNVISLNLANFKIQTNEQNTSLLNFIEMQLKNCNGMRCAGKSRCSTRS